MSNRLVLVLGLLLIGQVGGLFQSIGEASDNMGTLRGEVLAVNVKDSPQIVMMKVLVRGGKEMIVGALVEDETRISRKGQVVTLDQVSEGDTIVLKYEKTKEGVLARTIRVH